MLRTKVGHRIYEECVRFKNEKLLLNSLLNDLTNFAEKSNQNSILFYKKNTILCKNVEIEQKFYFFLLNEK
jgi:hypothetical protein